MASFCKFYGERHLQSLELSVNDVISTDVQNMLPLVGFAFFVSSMEKKLSVKFYSVLTIFLTFVNLSCFQWLNCVDAWLNLIHKLAKYYNCVLLNF